MSLRLHQLLMAVALATPWIANAQAVHPEAQLAAIRQALVEAVLDKPTKVSASAWIDGQGRLQETAHFQTDAQIRGVRVLAYTQEGEGVRASVQMEALPWSVQAAKAQPGETCAPAPQHWRQPLMIQANMQPGFRGPELFAAHAFLRQVTSGWRNIASQSTRWSVDDPALPATDAYSQAWLGQGAEPLGWQLQITLLPHGQAPLTQQTTLSTAQDAWLMPEEHLWTLKVAFGQKSSSSSSFQTHWEQLVPISVNRQELSYRPQQWAEALGGQLLTHFARWMNIDESKAPCEPVRFSVNRQNGRGWVAQAGVQSGLKVGDRVLIINATRVPGRVLDPGTTQQMAIAEVTRIGRRQSELKMLAGMPPIGQGDWVALPL